MWDKLFAGGDGLSRQKVDVVVRIIDRYLLKKTELRGHQTDKQTIRTTSPPPERHRAIICNHGKGNMIALLRHDSLA